MSNSAIEKGFSFLWPSTLPHADSRRMPTPRANSQPGSSMCLFVHTTFETHVNAAKKHEPQYLDARDTLAMSGVLHSSEHRTTEEQHDRVVWELCNPSSLEVARLMRGRRTAHEQGNRPPKGEKSMLLEARRELSHAKLAYANAKKNSESLNSRARQLREFKTKTESYRQAKDKAHHHETLLQWAIAQLPLIEQEEPLSWGISLALPSTETDEDGKPEPIPEPPRTLPSFGRLPAELRHIIWTDCLPPQPTAHFFEVRNHPRQRHMAQIWNSKEFRVCATKERDSGYRIIYTLLATCRESRIVTATYYQRLQAEHDPRLWQYPFPVFRDFNWIPADDLVVLCFRPKQAPLPKNHAITSHSGPARHVGLCFPSEVLMISQFGLADDQGGHLDSSAATTNDDSQKTLIHEFLAQLCGRRASDSPPTGAVPTGGRSTGSTAALPAPRAVIDRGIKNILVIYEGWTAVELGSNFVPGEDGHGHMPQRRREEVLASLRGGRVRWIFDAARPNETCVPWYQVSGVGLHPRDRTAANYRGRFGGRPHRRWWWLGSGDNVLGGRDIDELVERAPGAGVMSTLACVWQGCRARGWRELVGTEVLGWMLQEGDI